MGPLSGVIVLDLGQYLAGPFGPMLLADFGAEVIKVEPVRGDGMRLAGMPFVGCQRGKLDIAVDIKASEGLDAVMRLAEIADVVHHNMTKGTAARLGIDYESLKESATRTWCTAIPTPTAPRGHCRSSAASTLSTRPRVASNSRRVRWTEAIRPCISASG